MMLQQVKLFLLLQLFHMSSQFHHSFFAQQSNITQDKETDEDITDQDCLCGVPENAQYKLNNNNDDDDLVADRVTGGEITKKEKFPWTVRYLQGVP